MKRTVQLTVVTAMLFAVGTAMAAEKHSTEYNLAIIDGAVPVTASDASVVRFRSLLKQLDETYVENPQQIGDMTVTAQRLLKDDCGVEESLRNIMEGMNQIFYRKVENQKYAEYAAAYVQLRNKGMSHQAAVKGLRGIVNALLK